MIKRQRRLILTVIFIVIGFLKLAFANTEPATTKKVKPKPDVIIFVWDGLRPDSVSQRITPNLYKLANAGVWFNDQHSSYPTFTMMNASTFATGDFAGKTGFFGNTLWQPSAKGVNAIDKKVDFQQPVFTEDYKILQDLNDDLPLVEVKTLFYQAQKHNIPTVTVGKGGPAFFQDYHQKGIIFDESHVYPEEFARTLQKEHYALPVNTVYSYQDFTLAQNNGNPTAFGATKYLEDGVTTDPENADHSPYNQSNIYLMDSYLLKIAPGFKPKLSVVWLRNPDSTEHSYGVGSKAYYDALANQDELLGKLIAYLKETNKWENTNLIVVSDHSHSNVSAPLSAFPLRQINKKNKSVGKIDQQNGYAVSGSFRPADLLNRAGFKAYDGEGCQYDPVLSGIKPNGETVYKTQIDRSGKICHQKKGQKYTTPAYLVPEKLPSDAIIVAANGGSTYFYVPSHNKDLVKKLTRFIQSRQEFGAVFTSKQYGSIDGTLSMQLVKLENKNARNPDIIAGSSYDQSAKVKGYPGIEFSSVGHSRGMHGTFSPIDVRNTLIAYGPSFKEHFIDSLPSGNVDVAPTVAYILGFRLPNTDGRVLLESLKLGKPMRYFDVTFRQYKPRHNATGLTFYKATNPDNKDIIENKSNYSIILNTKVLSQTGKQYVYFDQAKAIRF